MVRISAMHHRAHRRARLADYAPAANENEARPLTRGYEQDDDDCGDAQRPQRRKKSFDDVLNWLVADDFHQSAATMSRASLDVDQSPRDLARETPTAAPQYESGGQYSFRRCCCDASPDRPLVATPATTSAVTNALRVADGDSRRGASFAALSRSLPPSSTRTLSAERAVGGLRHIATHATLQRRAAACRQLHSPSAAGQVSSILAAKFDTKIFSYFAFTILQLKACHF